jgi:hypothetical protein
MEATLFTGWIYDHLKPHAAAVKVAHPLMLRAQTGKVRSRTSVCGHGDPQSDGLTSFR